MLKLRPIPFAVLAAGLFATGGASAQSMSSIDAREAYQQDRIQDGRRDGALTRGETYRVEQGEQRIERYEAHARADGVVTPGERQRLDGMLDREGRQIYQQSHDNQRAWGGRDGDRHEGWNDGRNGWDRGRDGWDRGRDGGDHREGMNRDNDGRHNGWDRGRDGGDHREGMNRDNDGRRNGWDRAGGTPGYGGQPHQPGMPGGMQNASGQQGGGQYGGGHSGWANNGGGMQPGMQNGGQYGRPANGGAPQGGMQNISGQAGRPNYGGFQQGGMQNVQPNRGAAANQYARTNTYMPPASASAPRQATPVRTVSGGRSYGGRH
jgi:hypothetical protein